MKKLVNKHRLLFTAAFIISFFFLNVKTFAQDLDTLVWEEIVDMADTVYNSGLDTIYVIEDSLSETAGFRTGTTTDCLTTSPAMSINLNKTKKI